MLQDVPFEMYAIGVSDVAEAVAWLDTVDPSVDLPEIRLSAVSAAPSPARRSCLPRHAGARERFDHRFPELVQRIRGGEVGRTM